MPPRVGEHKRVVLFFLRPRVGRPRTPRAPLLSPCGSFDFFRGVRRVRYCTSTSGPFRSPRGSTRHARHPGSHEGRHNNICVLTRTSISLFERAARSPNAGWERWRARPGCGGERGEGDQPALAGAHSGTAGLHHRQKNVCVTLTLLFPPRYTVQRGM